MANSSDGNVAKQRLGSKGVWLTQLAREQLELQLAIALANATSLFVIDPALVDDDEIRELADLVHSFPHLARISIIDLACFVQAEPDLVAFIEWLTSVPSSFRERMRPISVLITALEALDRDESEPHRATTSTSADVWESVLRPHPATVDKRRGAA